MNVIVICLDTFRADLVGDNEKLGPTVATPNLDRLAARSAVFTRAFGEAQPTLQARRAFFTGMRGWPWRFNFDRRGHVHHAAGWHKIPPEHDTMAELLVERGVYTGLVADTYHMFKPTMNYTRGFCAWEFIRGQELDNYRAGTPETVLDRMRRHVRSPIDWRRNLTLFQYLLNNRGREKEDDYLVARVMNTAARWLDDAHPCRPFFLWVDAFDPHEPWDPPREYADRYCPGYEGLDFILPGNLYEGDGPTDEEIERVKALYYGEVTFCDKWVGRLLDKLDEHKLWDDTVVVFTSDHGTQVFDDGSPGKGGGNLRAYNTRIPMIVRHPDGPRGRSFDAFVQAHDLMPTLMKFFDIDVEVDGRDFWPCAAGNGEAIRDHVVIGWAGGGDGPAKGYVSARDDEWNYIVASGAPDDDPKLYRLASDPEEKTNVVDAHPDVVERQRARIERVFRQPLPGRHVEVFDSHPPCPPNRCRLEWLDRGGGPGFPE